MYKIPSCIVYEIGPEDGLLVGHGDSIHWPAGAPLEILFVGGLSGLALLDDLCITPPLMGYKYMAASQIKGGFTVSRGQVSCIQF